jgi:hypothetical protein
MMCNCPRWDGIDLFAEGFTEANETCGRVSTGSKTHAEREE